MADPEADEVILAKYMGMRVVASAKGAGDERRLLRSEFRTVVRCPAGRAHPVDDPGGVVEILIPRRLDETRADMLVIDVIGYAVRVHCGASARIAKKFEGIDKFCSDRRGQIR